jgi:hypothetical protein
MTIILHYGIYYDRKSFLIQSDFFQGAYSKRGLSKYLEAATSIF